MPISGVLMNIAMESMMPMDSGKQGKQVTDAEHNKRTLTLTLTLTPTLTPTLTLTLTLTLTRTRTPSITRMRARSWARCTC